VAGAYSAIAAAADVKVTLSGDQEVPAVNTAAKGSGTVTIGDDGAVKGTITYTGVARPPRTSTWPRPARTAR
jgi:D-arabinose 5-phosphate isomerase GutQ